MSLAKVSVAFLAVMLVVVAICPMQLAVAQPDNGFWAGHAGRYGDIGSPEQLRGLGLTPFYGPDTYGNCRAVLHARGLLQGDDTPWLSTGIVNDGTKCTKPGCTCTAYVQSTQPGVTACVTCTHASSHHNGD